jgi:hypothetical protein
MSRLLYRQYTQLDANMKSATNPKVVEQHEDPTQDLQEA